MMRNLLVIVATAVVALVVLLGLNWFGLVSQDAVAVGFITGLVIAIIISLSNRKKGSTG
jgi:hypothetical protein